MATAIEWAANPDGSAGETWNPIVGCSIASAGCIRCYAMIQAAGPRLARTPKYQGLTVQTKAGPVWTGEVRFWRSILSQPRRWTRSRTIFVNSMGDLFAEGVELDWLDEIFDEMEAADWHTYTILTKRADAMEDYLARRWAARPPPAHIWLGISAEDQLRFDLRWPALARTPAAVRLFSFEPLIGPIDPGAAFSTGLFHWAIVGGESGDARARPMRPAWALTLLLAARHWGLAFFFKQWGAWAPAGPRTIKDVNKGEYRLPWGPDGPWMRRAGRKAPGRELDGDQYSERPPFSHLAREAA